MRNRGRLKVLNDTKLILDDQKGHSDSFSYAQFGTIQRFPIPKPRKELSTFLEARCSEMALAKFYRGWNNAFISVAAMKILRAAETF